MDLRRLMLLGIDSSVPLEEQALDYFIPPIGYESGSTWKYGSHNEYFYITEGHIYMNTVGNYSETRPSYLNSPLYDEDQFAGLLVLFISDTGYSVIVVPPYNSHSNVLLLNGNALYGSENSNTNGVSGYSYVDGKFYQTPIKVATLNYSIIQYAGAMAGYLSVSYINNNNFHIYILPINDSMFAETYMQLLSQIIS